MTEFVEPLGMRILIRKDESRQTTRGGIVLPDDAEIPTITGRIVEISAQIERDEDFPIRKYDKVLFHPKHAIPVDLESSNKLFVVPVEDIVAVFRKSKAVGNPLESLDEGATDDDYEAPDE
jgi:chaperonin GroES